MLLSQTMWGHFVGNLTAGYTLKTVHSTGKTYQLLFFTLHHYLSLIIPSWSYIFSVFEGINHITRNILVDPIAPGSMTGTLMPFDQNVFLGGDAFGASFYEQGFYYAPPRCLNGSTSAIQCKLHVFFHGCEMGYEYIGTDFIQTAGFLEVAEANDMIMIFPTVTQYTHTDQLHLSLIHI